MRAQVNVPYLERREKRLERTGRTRVYFYWVPRAVDRQRFGVKTTRLARGAIAEASEDVVLRLAIDEAQELNTRLKRLRGGYVTPAEEIEGTLPWLIREFRRTAKYERLSHATRQRTYECWWPLLTRWSEANGHPDVRTLETPVVQKLYEDITMPDPDTGERQLAKGKNVIASLRRALSYAKVKLTGVKSNAAFGLERASVAPRLRVWSDEELESFCRKAKSMKMPSLAFAARLTRDTAFRRKDLVELTAGSWNGEKFLYRQSKGKEIVAVPATQVARPLIQEWIAARKLEPESHLIANDKTGEPYTGDAFGKQFQQVCAEAGLEDLWFHDLRRTCVLRLARAGATIPQISAITGHTLQSVHRILRHYLPRDSEVAASGIRKLDHHQAKRRAAATRPRKRAAAKRSEAAHVG